MSKFVDYLRETRTELKHVSWPTRKQALIYSALVVAVSVIIAVFTAGFDTLFTQGLNWFIK